MKHNEFLTLMESYYGEYNKQVKLKLLNYLLLNVQEEDLQLLENLTYKDYSMRWKMPPDIAIIQEIINNENEDAVTNEQKIGIGNKEYRKALDSKKLKQIK